MAPAAMKQQIINELQKLVKQDLISYIIYKKLPESVVSKLSQEVVKFLEGNHQEEDVFHDSISTEREVCRNLSCLNKLADLRVTECEINMQNRLIQELEQSIKNLNTIISLVSTKNGSEVIQNQNNNPSQYEAGETNAPATSVPSLETGGQSPAVSTKTDAPLLALPPYAVATTASVGSKNSSTARQTTSSVVSLNQRGSTFKQPQCYRNNSRTIITPQQVSHAVHEAQSRKILNDLTSSDQPTHDRGWKEVKYKRRRPMIGTHTEANGTSLSGVPKVAVLHVSRIAPETTCEKMKCYLQPRFPEVTVETMISRYPERYASFKISIYEKNFKTAMNPDLWPQDCCVQRFFFRRKAAESIR